VTELYLKYYFDVSRYNLLFSILVIILTQNLLAAVVYFGTLGSVVSLALFRYHQNIEYYFYLNAGLSKKAIILKSFIINLVISVILAIIFWGIH
jgi:uncharacterized MnhB-related membrane protein